MPEAAQELKVAIDALRAEIANLSPLFADFNTNLNANLDKVLEVSGKLEALTQTHGDRPEIQELSKLLDQKFDDAVLQLKDMIDKLVPTGVVNSEELEWLRRDNAEALRVVGVAQETCRAQSAHLTTANERIRELERDLANVEAARKAAEARVGADPARVTELAEQIANLNQRLDNAAAEIKRLEADKEMLRADAMKSAGEATQQKERADNLDAQLKARPTEAEHRQLQDELLQVNADKAAAEQEREEWKAKKTPATAAPSGTPSASNWRTRVGWVRDHPGSSIAAAVAVLLLIALAYRGAGAIFWPPVAVDQSAQIVQLQKEVADWKQTASSNDAARKDAETKLEAAIGAQKTAEGKLAADDQEIKNLNDQLKDAKEQLAKAEVPAPPAPAPAPAQTEAPAAPVAQPQVPVADAGQQCTLAGTAYVPSLGRCAFRLN